MSDSLLNQPDGSHQGSGVKTAILFGAVIALIGACVYLYSQIKQVRDELATTKESLLAEMAQVHESTTQTSKKSVETMKTDVDEARRMASQLAGQAKIDATKHADELAAQLKQTQERESAEQSAKVSQVADRVTAVSSEVSQVKEDASQTKGKVGEVSTDLANVKTDAAATRGELEKTIADLKSTKGDLGVQSGLIATNSKELSALRALGERNYVEFRLAKEKTPRKIGDLMVRLTAADAKKNRYTIEVIADDKKMEKKDKTINEPVQFILPRATIPYELVVNEVKKDMIAGYLSAPKVQQARTAASQ